MTARQLWAATRAEHPAATIAVAVGDFYEFWHHDAAPVAAALGLTLTARRMNGESVPMCGVPYHRLHPAIDTLRAAGFDVIVCDKEAAK